MWQPDNDTFSKLKKLLNFIDFISNLEHATENDRLKAEEIKNLILNLKSLEVRKNWIVSLYIFDRDVQCGHVKEGFYLRKWCVSFEKETLEIEAESKHTSDAIGHFGDDFYYYGHVFFENDLNIKRVYLKDDIDNFISDAFNYEKYITESLNDIEIEIDVF